MKKGFKIICLTLAIMLCVGCMDIKVKMDIKNDKSVDVAMTYKMDMVKYMEAVYSLMGESKTESEIKEYLKENNDEIDTSEYFDDEQKKELEKAGYKVNMNMDNENYIYTIDISQHFANIEDISSNEEKTVNLGDIFSGETNNIFFTKTENGTYKANFVVDTSNTDDNSTEYDIKELEEFMTFNYEITLPNASISNNADKISDDKKTLSWDLNAADKINFEFAFPTNKTTKTNPISNLSDDNLKILAIGLITGGSVTLVVTLIAYVISAKKQKD